MVLRLRGPSREIAPQRPDQILLAGALVNGHGGDQARVRMALETGQKLNENAFVNKIVVIKNEEIVT